MPIIIKTGTSEANIAAQINQAQSSGEEFIFNEVFPKELAHALKVIFTKKLTKFTLAFLGYITAKHIKKINKYLNKLPLPNNILLNIKLDPINQTNTDLFEKFDGRWHSLITFYMVDIELEAMNVNSNSTDDERQIGQKYKISQEKADTNKNNKKLRIVAESDNKFVFAAAIEEHFSQENGVRCAYDESLLFSHDLDRLRQNSEKTQLEIPFILKTGSIEKVLTKITSIRLFEDIKIYISRAENNFKELQKFLAKSNDKLKLTIHVTQLLNKNYLDKEINFKIHHHRIILEGDIINIVLISTVHTSPIFNHQHQIQGYKLSQTSNDVFKAADDLKWKYKKFTTNSASEYSLNDTFIFSEPKPRNQYFIGKVVYYNYSQSKFFQRDIIKLKNNLNITNVDIPYFFHGIILRNVLSEIISIRSFEKIKIYIQPTKINFKELQTLLTETKLKLNLIIYVAKSHKATYSKNNLVLKTLGHNITLEGETKNIGLESVATRFKSPDAALAITRQTDLPQPQYTPTFFSLVKMDEETLTKSENTPESSTNKWLDDVNNLYNSKFLRPK